MKSQKSSFLKLMLSLIIHFDYLLGRILVFKIRISQFCLIIGIVYGVPQEGYLTVQMMIRKCDTEIFTMKSQKTELFKTDAQSDYPYLLST